MYRLKIMFFSLFISIVVFVSCLLVPCALVGAEESISIISYYPSPYGVYNEMRLFPHAAPVTVCDVSTEGTMFYNSTAGEVQICTGIGGWGGSSSFWAGSGNNIYNTNSGYVGVGTNNPDSPFHVYAATGYGEVRIKVDEPTRSADVHYKADSREWSTGVAGSNHGDLSNSFWIKDETANKVRLAIKTDGRVGIGTEMPKGKLDINGTLYFAGGGGYPFINFPPIGVESSDEAFFLPTLAGDSDLRLYIEDNWDDRFTIWGNSCYGGDCGNLAVSTMQHAFQANGNAYHKGKLGVGKLTPTAGLHIYGDAEMILEINNDPNKYTDIHFDNTNAGGRDYVIGNYGPNHSLSGKFFIRDNAGGDRFIIDSSGRVGIGVTSPAYRLQLSTDSAAKPTSNLWTVPSDIRIKKDILPFTDGLGVIERINPVNYKLNGKAGLPLDEPGIGVVAQDVKDVVPYTIKTWKAKLEPADSEETELYDFDSNALTYVLINAVKEQQKQIDVLKNRIMELKQKKLKAKK